MRAKVGVLGHFGEGADLLNGQTIKTKIITEELQTQLGKDQVLKIDTHGGWKTLFKAPFQVVHALKNSTNILIFPAHNGLRVYAPLLSFQKLFFKKRKLHYVVIGGWLPQFLTRRKCLSRILKKFDGIYVETESMKNALEAQEFKNIFVMPNCKNIDILKTEDLIYVSETPLKVCTFSRVIKEKGIEDAIAAVHSANEKIGKTAYHLDIYGEVGELQYEWFRSIENNFGTRIVYKGFVEPNTSVAVLKNYFALLFPTYYEGEGFAGTIIDAFASGVPVVASDWKYNCEIIREGHDGTVFPARDVCALTDKLVEIYENIDAWNAMKPNCLDRATEYLSENVIQVLTERL